MMPDVRSIKAEIEERVRAALAQVAGAKGEQADPLVRPTQDPAFGDYQSNAALALAKIVGRKPRDLAQGIVAALSIEDVCTPPEIAGPGFINFRVRPEYVATRLEGLQADPRLGVPEAAESMRVIVDFSSPNVAKEMHVGHLPSTAIGDAIARLLEFQGHDVLRLNHVGDWGTQFGMLIQHVRERYPEALARPEAFRIDDLEGLYRDAKERFDEEPAFADAARRAVVELQSGEETARALWQAICHESIRHCQEIYDRLDVRIEERGESFYNPLLPGIVAELRERGLAVEHEGAICIFPPGFKNREGAPLPLIAQKGGGGYNYATTDLAAVRHRIEVEKARRIIYVTDIRQHQHFEMVFAAARMAGWVPEGVVLEHVGFGLVLGPDRRPFKTREGGTVRLKELLDEAEARALAMVGADDERRRTFDEKQRAEIARVVGLGALKYAQLNHNITTDSVFDWDTMLAMDGNTAPYLQYAYARVRSIGRRAGIDYAAMPANTPIRLEHESEVALGKELLNFGPVLEQFAAELRPHLLTDYLYGLSRAFSTLFDRQRGVRVVNAETEELRNSRLRLCDLTGRTLELGLGLLGIRVLEEM